MESVERTDYNNPLTLPQRTVFLLAQSEKEGVTEVIPILLSVQRPP